MNTKHYKKEKTMKTGAIIVAGLLLSTLASPAEARCAQEDLSGRWTTFIMNLNSAGHLSVQECRVTSDGTNEFQPVRCVGGVITLVGSRLRLSGSCRLTGNFTLVLREDHTEVVCAVSAVVSISKEIISGQLVCGNSESVLTMVKH